MSRGDVVAEPAVPSRRSAQREHTLAEIRTTARELLVAEGVGGVTLRPIARALGLTAPALYRYFDSREELLLDLTSAVYDELVGVMEGARDGQPPTDMAARFAAVVQAFRQWAVAHPREFGLVFATPIGPAGSGLAKHHVAGGDRFGQVWIGMFLALWMQGPFDHPADAELDPGLRRQIEEWAQANDIPVPLGALAIFLQCWVRIYGLVSLEVFGHLGFALSDVGPMYDAMLSELAARLGMTWPPT